MDRVANEIAIIEDVAAEATEGRISELNELQLALVGGGSADPILH